MKKVTVLAVAIMATIIILMTACRKDTNSAKQGDSPSKTKDQKAKVTRPLKVDLFSAVDSDPSIPPTACSGDLPGLANAGYFLHGNATHLGRVKPENSRGQDVTCHLNAATAILSTTVKGQLSAANGDLIFYTGIDEIDVKNLITGAGTNGTITGVWTITGGTGRFKGAIGVLPIKGTVDFVTSTFSITGEGSINY